MPNQDPKRDLQADRAKLTELKEQARNDLSWGVALDVFSRTALPHYLTRTEEAERRVAELEAACDNCAVVKGLEAEVTNQREQRIVAESALAHERRKVEAAVDELVRQRPCPPRIPCPPDAHPFETEREQCMKCWSDYLNQRAKEGMKSE